MADIDHPANCIIKFIYIKFNDINLMIQPATDYRALKVYSRLPTRFIDKFTLK